MSREQNAPRATSFTADPEDFRVGGPVSNGLTFKVIPKGAQSAIIPDHLLQLLRKIGNAQAEIGRLNKLVDEIRADVLHLTTE